MGKRIISQRRGRGTPTYRAPSHRFKAGSRYGKSVEESNGTIIDITSCPAHSGPIANIDLQNGERVTLVACEGMRIGDSIDLGASAPVKPGNILPLEKIPEGTFIFNIEMLPGDGGKFVRSSGTFARVVTRLKDSVLIMLPSKKNKRFNPKCRASIGIVAGGGRKEKPFLKAGNRYYARMAKNKLWPRTSGAAMNAVDHPFGNKRSSRKSKARPAPKNAPPGRKVGMIRPRRAGRKKA